MLTYDRDEDLPQMELNKMIYITMSYGKEVVGTIVAQDDATITIHHPCFVVHDEIWEETDIGEATEFLGESLFFVNACPSDDKQISVIFKLYVAAISEMNNESLIKAYQVEVDRGSDFVLDQESENPSEPAPNNIISGKGEKVVKGNFPKPRGNA